MAQIWLVTASMIYYAWWNIYYLPILLLSIGFNYFIGRLLQGELSIVRLPSRPVLLFGIAMNLFILGYFKYYNFFLGNASAFIVFDMPFIALALPLGISFFTFQQITYFVDSSQGKAESGSTGPRPTERWRHFSGYIKENSSGQMILRI